MHGLDIIIRRNAEAAGREEAHARNDREHVKAFRIRNVEVLDGKELNAYDRGYDRGRQEG